MLNLNKMLNF